MYAIVKSGGKQYRVERGQQLLIERLPDDEGASVALEPILYRSEEAIFDRDGLDRVKVTAKVLGHVRGEKLRVFKFKPKRGYKRRTGHRQELTRIEVTEITAGPARRAGRARRADASGETEAKAPVKAPDTGEAKPTETAGAKPTGTARAKPTGTARAKPTGAAKAAEAKTTETPKPKRAKKTSAQAKETDAAAKETHAAAKETEAAAKETEAAAKESSARPQESAKAAKEGADGATDSAEPAETGKQSRKAKKEAGQDGT